MKNLLRRPERSRGCCSTSPTKPRGPGHSLRYLGLATAVVLGAAFTVWAADPFPEGTKLRQVRPFVPSPLKPTSKLSTDPTPSGGPLPTNIRDEGTLVIRPGEDTRLLATNRQMVVCRESANLNSRPLMYEDVPLERVGYQCCPAVQPVVSAVKFYGAFPLVVPRGPQRHDEWFVGTTEARYFGPIESPSPFYLEVSSEQVERWRQPTDAPAGSSDRSESVPPPADRTTEVRFAPLGYDILTVGADEPIEDLESVLPGFIRNDAVDVQPQEPTPSMVSRHLPTNSPPVPLPAVEALAPQPSPAVAKQQVVVQRGQAPTVVPVASQTVAGPALAVPGSTTTYVFYPTADGGFIPVAREMSQVAAYPSPYPSTALPPAPRAVAAPPAAAVAPAVAPSASYNPYPAAGRIAASSPDSAANPEDRWFPLISHVFFGEPTSGSEPLPTQPAVPMPPPNLAPPEMIGVAPQPGAWGANSYGYQDGCCTSGPRSCCYGGCKPYVDIESTFLAPILDGNTLSASAFDVTTTYAFTGNTSGMSYLAAAPRVTLGLGSCCGRGARFRYWQMNSSHFETNSLNFADPNDFTGFTSTGQFRAYTFDLEATREFCCCHKTFLGFFGVRYVGLSQAESLYAQVLTQPFPDLLTAHGVSQSQFYGTGLTWGLQCVEPICCKCWGELDFFAAGRGSAIFGSSSAAVASSAQIGGAGAVAVSNNQANADQQNTLMIGELQTGLQWTRYVCGPCCVQRVFARFAFEYQYWGLVNGPDASTNSFAGRSPFDQISISAVQPNFANINLVGFTLSAGCYW